MLPHTDQAESSTATLTHRKPRHPRGGPCEESLGTHLPLWFKENPTTVLVSSPQNGVECSCHALNQ